jgi:hypothetical protein
LIGRRFSITARAVTGICRSTTTFGGSIAPTNATAMPIGKWSRARKSKLELAKPVGNVERHSTPNI